MISFSLRHLSNGTLRSALAAGVARERGVTAWVLAHIAEFDSRRLYAEDGYASMYAYCVGALGFSEEAAFKRIHAARAAYRFPEIFGMVADGRLTVSAVVTLAPHLTEATAPDLLASSARQTRKAIERMLAERFPRPDLATVLGPIEPAHSGNEHAPGRVESLAVELAQEPEPGTLSNSGTAHAVSLPVAEPPVRSRVMPLAPGRVALQTTVDQETEDLVREAHELLGHPTSTSHVPDVLKAAMRLYVAQLRRQKFAETDAPRAGRGSSHDSRHIPNDVKRAVWVRDEGRCTYTSPSGHRCEERAGLEFDHIVPYALGGDSSVSNIRLRCRTHNQLEAERIFGARLIEAKHEQAQEAAGERRRSRA